MHFSQQEKTILKELSSNSRATISHLAKVAGCSRATLLKMTEKLTNELKIRLTLEINLDKLGLSERYLIAVKFKTQPPDEALKALFKTDQYSQCVYRIKGRFDLLIYVVADSPVNYTKWETRLAEDLSQYGAAIMPSRYVFSHFGYLPLNDSFTDFIDEVHGLDDTDKQILKTLNGYSRASYGDIGKSAGISEATARYRLFRLIRKGIIKRFTIAVQAPPAGYSAFAYFINYVFTKTTSTISFANARECYLSDDDNSPLLNTFQLIFPISGSFRSFGMVLCENRTTAFDKAVRRHKKIFKNENIRIIYGEISGPIKGIMPFRSLNIRNEYNVVSWHGYGV